jgi:hypothetical protein
VKIAGIAKGSGMIAPDMATMLAFVATDAAIAPGALQTLVSLYTRSTFNCVTVDGDRSTNDTLLPRALPSLHVTLSPRCPRQVASHWGNIQGLNRAQLQGCQGSRGGHGCGQGLGR